jgi:hypothetical protein
MLELGLLKDCESDSRVRVGCCIFIMNRFDPFDTYTSFVVLLLVTISLAVPAHMLRLERLKGDESLIVHAATQVSKVS